MLGFSSLRELALAEKPDDGDATFLALWENQSATITLQDWNFISRDRLHGIRVAGTITLNNWGAIYNRPFAWDASAGTITLNDWDMFAARRATWGSVAGGTITTQRVGLLAREHIAVRMGKHGRHDHTRRTGVFLSSGAGSLSRIGSDCAMNRKVAA